MRPIKAKDDKGRVAGVDIRVDPSIWQEFNEKAQQERKSATTKIAELITNEIEARSDLRVELPKTAQGKLDAAHPAKGHAGAVQPTSRRANAPKRR
jgi:hypothetical protein